jgi:hypothetical protein
LGSNLLVNAAFAMVLLDFTSCIHLASLVIMVPKQLKYSTFSGCFWYTVIGYRGGFLPIADCHQVFSECDSMRYEIYMQNSQVIGVTREREREWVRTRVRVCVVSSIKSHNTNTQHYFHVLEVWDSHNKHSCIVAEWPTFIDLLVWQHVSTPSVGSSSGLRMKHLVDLMMTQLNGSKHVVKPVNQ